MKTAISLPDEIFREAERLAKRLKKSRSAVFREAVAEYVARHEPEAVTGEVDRVVDALDSRLDRAVAAAAVKVLRRSEW